MLTRNTTKYRIAMINLLTDQLRVDEIAYETGKHVSLYAK